MKWIISLCDYTGIAVAPWVEFGYQALLVDPQHTNLGSGNIVHFPGTILEAMPIISWLIRSNQVAFVCGFPPCTDVAVSGARWWAEKAKADPYFQAKAAIVAEQCRTIGELSGAPWYFENPVGGFSSIFGKANYIFHPADYAGYVPEDNYFKTTCIWAGNGFVMPPKHPRGQLGKPDSRIFEAVPGEDRANFRSKTPLGFSIGVFLSNRLESRV